MSKMNIKWDGQSYLRTFIIWDTLVYIQKSKKNKEMYETGRLCKYLRLLYLQMLPYLSRSLHSSFSLSSSVDDSPLSSSSESVTAELICNRCQFDIKRSNINQQHILLTATYLLYIFL